MLSLPHYELRHHLLLAQRPWLSGLRTRTGIHSLSTQTFELHHQFHHQLAGGGGSQSPLSPEPYLRGHIFINMHK